MNRWVYLSNRVLVLNRMHKLSVNSDFIVSYDMVRIHCTLPVTHIIIKYLLKLKKSSHSQLKFTLQKNPAAALTVRQKDNAL